MSSNLKRTRSQTGDMRVPRQSDPAVLLNDLLEIEDSPYAAYASGMTRQNTAAIGGPGAVSVRDAAVGRELRPGFVRFLDRGQGEIVPAILAALRAAGTQERQWARATALRGQGLTHSEIAQELGVGRSTVSEWLAAATEWIRDYLIHAEWVAVVTEPGGRVRLERRGEVA